MRPRTLPAACQEQRYSKRVVERRPTVGRGKKDCNACARVVLLSDLPAIGLEGREMRRGGGMRRGRGAVLGYHSRQFVTRGEV